MNHRPVFVVHAAFSSHNKPKKHRDHPENKRKIRKKKKKKKKLFIELIKPFGFQIELGICFN